MKNIKDFLVNDLLYDMEYDNYWRYITEYVTENNLVELNVIDAISKLIELEELKFANWLITRTLGITEIVLYAIFAAEMVLPIFEKKYPNDNRPRESIRIAKLCFNDPPVEYAKILSTSNEISNCIWDVDGIDAKRVVESCTAVIQLIIMM